MSALQDWDLTAYFPAFDGAEYRAFREALEPRAMGEAQIGDWLVIEGAGAYCAAMSTTNYNSFPQAPEALLKEDGSVVIIRRRQTLEQIVQNEV